MADFIEISQRLHITIEQVQKSSTIQKTYNEIKDNPNMSNQEKEDAFDEMADVLKDMLQQRA